MVISFYPASAGFFYSQKLDEIIMYFIKLKCIKYSHYKVMLLLQAIKQK